MVVNKIRENMTILKLCIFNHCVIKTEIAKKAPAKKDTARKDRGGNGAGSHFYSIGEMQFKNGLSRIGNLKANERH